MIDLSTPIRMERVRSGFQPHWRTVFIYSCPDCENETRVFANSFIGQTAVPGVGAIRCSCEIAKQLIKEEV
jgi:ribosomal protein S27E